MKYEIVYTSKFKKSYKRVEKRGYPMECLHTVIKILADAGTLPPVYKDHVLTGNYAGCRECHIKPDWLLIYRIRKTLEVLDLVDTGSHSDLF